MGCDRRLACSEHVDELHTEPAWCDMRDGPDVACAWRRQVRPRVFGRSSMLPSPEPPPGVATTARAFVSPSTHAMSTHTPPPLIVPRLVRRRLQLRYLDGPAHVCGLAG